MEPTEDLAIERARGGASTRRVAVLGGGASGALVTAQLLCRLDRGDEVVLVQNGSPLCFGIAYATDDLEHRLNVRAHNMSAHPNRPAHFVEWLAAKGVGEAESLNEAFIARRVYREYLKQVVEEARRDSAATLRIVSGEAIGLQRIGSCLEVSLASGESLFASHAVLALGHLGPKMPPFLEQIGENPRFIGTPWPNELDAISSLNEDVLIVGTGLTMVDAAISLKSRPGSGRIYARSRHGLIPQSHCRGPKPPVTRIDEPANEIRSVARQIISQARAAGPDWRGVVDGCRSRTSDWWKGLGWSQRARFLRHLQAFWEVHRHRMPEDVYTVIKQMQIEERLHISAAREMSVEPHENGFMVSARRPDGGKESLKVGWIVNCTGPETDYLGAKLPVLESAVQSGLAEYDPLGLGLKIDDNHQTDPNGRVFALGPLCRGSLWETTAMPEIRVQANLIACQCAS